MTDFASIGVDTSLSQAELEAFLSSAIAAGPGIGLVSGSIVYSGADQQGATFTNGDALGVSSGFVLTTGAPDYTSPDTNDETNFGSNRSRAGDADLEDVIGRTTYDANSIEFQINVTDPDITFISFDVVFGSEEYPEFASNIVDIAGVFVNGNNAALFDNDPDAPLSVLQTNIDNGYILGSDAEDIPTEYDGVSRALQITAAVEQGLNTVKIAVADTNDRVLDSAIFVSNIRLTDSDGGSGINVPPEASDDAYSGDEDTDIVVAAAGLLANDSDFDEDPLTAVLVDGPAYGALTLNGNGSFTYTPDDDFSGTDSFIYAAEDPDGAQSEATVTLTVNEVNDAPVAGDDGPFEVVEGVGFFVGYDTLLINDEDGDAYGEQTLSITGIALAVGGTAVLGETGITFTANVANEAAYFKYTLSDGSLTDLGVVSFDVTAAPNAAPVAADDAVSGDEDTVLSGNVLGNDSDADEDTLTAELVGSAPAGLAFNPDGSFTYTPAADANGTVTFQYVASDGALSSEPATVTLTIDPVNDAPVGTDDTFADDEDTPFSGNVLANDTDVDNETLTATLVDGPASGSLDFNADGNFTYTPAANATGDVTFTYKASDGALQSELVTVTLTIEPVNDAPVGADDAYSGDEDTVLSGDVLANDSDVDSKGLTATLVDGPDNGTFTFNGSGAFVFTPDADFNGTETFTYKASDGELTSDLVTVTLTVDPVNDAPVAQDDTVSGDEDTVLSGNVLGNDSDVDGDSLTAGLVDGPAHGELDFNANGSFTYTPDDDFFGTDTFTYKADDGTDESDLATVTLTVAPVNDAPVANDDTFEGDEDEALKGSVLLNDTDTEEDELTVRLVSGPQTGELALEPDGQFTFAPLANATGDFTFTYVANDGESDSESATVTLTINPVNDAPVGTDDAVSGDEDTVLSGNVLANDSDVDNITLSALLVTGPETGTLVLNANGTFTFTPDEDFAGTETFTYRASDGELTSEPVTVTLSVDPVNDAPVGTDDAVSGDEDTVLSGDVLANDSDVDGDTLTATLVEGPESGTLDLDADGGFAFTPDADFNGTEAFTYRASDGTLTSDPVTVTLTVDPVNDAPVAADDAVSGEEGMVLSGNVLDNDSDVDGDDITATLVDEPDSGSLDFNADGSFTYTPAETFNGTETFTYRASDGALESGIATVTLTVTPVNTAPVGVADSVSGNEDTVLSGNVLDNDTDVDSEVLTATLLSAPSDGSLTLSPNGVFSYTPAADAHGTRTFTYEVSDGAKSDGPITVTLTINPVNDAPVAEDDAASGSEDEAISGSVLGNDSDVDGDDLSASLATGPAHGEVSLLPDGTFTYTPDADFNGTDSFTYVAADDGEAESEPATVTITVAPVNDAPVPEDDAAQGDEDTPISGDVLANDVDVDGDTLTASVVSGPKDGSLDLGEDGTFTYTPDEDWSGTDSFTYLAGDGTTTGGPATVTITVAPVNDAPVGVPETFGSENASIIGNVLENDTDAEGDALTAILVSEPETGTLTFEENGDFTYNPGTAFPRTETFTYRASDGDKTSEPVTVTLIINPLNDPPHAVADLFELFEDGSVDGDVLANDMDFDFDPLTAAVVSGPAHGSLNFNSDGTFSYTPDENFNGTDQFTYQADDGELKSPVTTVTLEVEAVNDVPVAADDAASGNEDEAITGDVLANDTDTDGDTLTAVLESDVSNGTLVLKSNGSFTYTPDENFNGTDSFTYRASDGTDASAARTVTLTVEPVNDAPVATGESRSGIEDTVLTGSVLGNDSDADGDTLTAVLVSGPAHGALSLNPDGTFSYTPDENFNGTDTFRYRASDGTTTSGIVTTTLTIAPRNDKPNASADAFSGREDGDLSGNVLDNDSDLDGDQLTAVLESDVSNGTLVLKSNGSFTYTPDENFNGEDSFTYHASDGSAQSAARKARLTVEPVNDAPVATGESRSGNEDAVLTGSVLGNDSDADGDTLTAVLVSGPAHGSLSLNPDGTFSYTPDENFNGTDTFRYRASDGTTTSGIVTTTLNIAPRNDKPNASADAFSGREDRDLSGNVLANDSDVDGDRLSAVLESGVSNGTLAFNSDGTFTYTPHDNFNGEDSFTYRASDGLAQSAARKVRLAVAPANDAPVAKNDARQVREDETLESSVLGNDNDIDEDPLEAVLVRGPSHGTLTLNDDGTFSYTPDADYNGADAFTYRASDGTATSNLATVALTVKPANDAPVAQNDTFTGNEDGSITGDVTGNDSDPEGHRLFVTNVNGPSHGTLRMNARGEFTYTPDEDFSGTDSFTYRASDGSAKSGVATVTLKVAAVSDDPVARNDSGFSVTAGEQVTLRAADLLANDSDGDPELKEALSIVSVDQVVGGTARVTNAGNIVFEADDGVAGTATLRYTVEDDAGNTDTAKVSVEVEPEQVFSDVSLGFVLQDDTPSLVYTVEGNEAASTAQFLEVGDPLDDLPITLSAEDSDDGTLADYPIDPDQFGGLFGPDFVDETRVTSDGIAIVDGEDYYFSDTANTIEGDEALLIDFDTTADIASAGSAKVRLNGITGDERVRAQIFVDGELVGTFTSNGSTIDLEAPTGETFDTVRLFALGNTDFTFESITLFDVFERPVLEI